MTYQELPEGYGTFYSADVIELVTPEGKCFSYPPDTPDALIWEKAWELATESRLPERSKWLCGDPLCLVCQERVVEGVA
jgi:hypothetical protein